MSAASQASRPAPASMRWRSHELDRLRGLNAAYREKFGFPFLYAVKGSTTADILKALERRLRQCAMPSIEEALRQVSRIARFRLEDVIYVNRFATGPKRHYYGKGDVIVYRLNRDGRARAGGSPVFGANVLMLALRRCFWNTYTTGDNTGLIATDSMKNFIQRETMNFDGMTLEEYCRFLAETFLAMYAQVEGLQISASEIPYVIARRRTWHSTPSGPGARIGAPRDRSQPASSRPPRACAASSCCGLAAARFTGSCATSTRRCRTCTNRPLHMWLDLEWRYATPAERSAAVRRRPARGASCAICSSPSSPEAFSR